MPEAICNTSPLLYLYRLRVLDWLSQIFSEVWTPQAVALEIQDGQVKGYDVPTLNDYAWLQIVEPRSLTSEWLALDLGAGELATLSLALENPSRIIVLDDAFARRTAQAAGLKVWGTLKVLLEAKSQGLTRQLAPLISQLEDAGMWISHDIRQRILMLANEVKE